MAELVPIVSEALEAQVRDLLPSQRGFGEDLQASNVITPIIDLTPTAEGSKLPSYLQSALAFGSQTSFNFSANSLTLVNNTGFYRCYGVVNNEAGAATASAVFRLSNGLSTKLIWQMAADPSATDHQQSLEFDFVVFLAPGESLEAQSNSTTTNINGSTRQLADVNGNLVNPSGFSPQ